MKGCGAGSIAETVGRVEEQWVTADSLALLADCISACWARCQAFCSIDESTASEGLLALTLVVQEVSIVTGHARSGGEAGLAVGRTAPTSPGLEVGVVAGGADGQALGAKLEERELAVRSKPLNTGSEPIVRKAEGTTINAVSLVEESIGAQRGADTLRVLILAGFTLRLSSAGIVGGVVSVPCHAAVALGRRSQTGSAGR